MPKNVSFFPLEFGNGFLSGLFQVLFDRLVPHFSLSGIIVLDETVRSTLNRWFTKTAIIQAALDDAEEKQWTNDAIKMWLDDLRDFSYDLEDMLDERNTELSGRSSTETSPISKFIEVVKGLVTNMGPMSASGRMYERLVELCDRRNLLGLIERTAGGPSTAAWQRPPSTCVPTETVVYGRDEDIRKIFEMIDSRDANFHVISIVGMAGVGKTILAQTVYNRCGETDFKRKAWVCVSDDFDILRISMAILESLTGSPCHLKNLNEVQVQLRRTVKDSKFLLVLDDVWSKSYDSWEILRSPFAAGAQGSKIIVTTRSVDVALTIGGPSACYHLKLLSDEDCWRVFEKHVREYRDVGAYSNLESFREKVVRNCEGLPLAARALGGLLRSKESNDEWNDVLNSKLWELPKECNILPVLKLSYYHLPWHLKRCFAHCAILPKNYEFEEKELVFFWMVEGLILPSNRNKQLEDIGHEYFHDLLSRSIFQKSSGDTSKFVMHSLFNELAQWVSGETSFKLEDELGTNQHSKRVHRARHSSYICGQYDHISKFEVFFQKKEGKFEVSHEVRQLRTFLPVLTQNVSCYISDAVLQHLHEFEKLRMLSLQMYRMARLPCNFTGLRYLRYLNLSNSDIKILPPSIARLYNLQILILRNCSYLSGLPHDVKNLINLRHLDIKGAILISEMPPGMQELKRIQTLSDFIVSNSSRSSSSGHLKDLKKLKFLRGELRISQLQNLPELREAILSDKEKLEVLILEWGLGFNSRNEEREKDVLDMLEPHTNLKQITIRHYGGSAFPSWVGDPRFSNIAVLRLEDCKKCTSLPPLGLLGSLKDLTITGMTELEKIDLEFYGNIGCSKPFRSLETLFLENLGKWQNWIPVENNERDSFGSLRELSIKDCPMVQGSLPKHLPKLQKLVIQQCEKLEISFSSIPDLCEVEMDGCQNMGSTNAGNFGLLKSISLSNISCHNWFSETFQKVEHLKVNKCSDLVSTLESFPLNCLRKLEIENCSMPTSLDPIKQNSVCLDCLKIKDCKDLSFIVKDQFFPKLKKLEIHNNQKLQHLSSNGQLPETLRRLEIRDCPMLTTLGHLPEKLEHLEIKKCGNLISLSEGELPASLERLNIEDCLQLSNFTPVPGRLPQGLKQLTISECQSLRSFPLQGLPSSSLTILRIKCCDSLQDLPTSMHSLTSLQELDISKCESIRALPNGGFPTKITSLYIENPRIYSLLNQWGLYKFTSLRKLRIVGCADGPDAVSFPNTGVEMMLPTSLNDLILTGFPRLTRLSSGFNSLTSLEYLTISDCLELASFPQDGLPSSLLVLHINNCPKLEGYCHRTTGREWRKIANIPFLEIV